MAVAGLASCTGTYELPNPPAQSNPAEVPFDINKLSVASLSENEGATLDLTSANNNGQQVAVALAHAIDWPANYLLDLTMDKICERLDPESFFRVSRGCIVRREAVKTVLRHLNGRLKLELSVRTPEELFVSRSRVDDFLAWLE